MRTDRYLCREPGFFAHIGSVFFIIAILAGCLLTAGVSYGSSPPEAAHIKTAGNLHEKPAADSPVMAELRVGDQVTLIHRNYEWHIIKLPDDRLGWIHQSLLVEKRVIAAQPQSEEKGTKTLLAEVSPDEKTLMVKVRAARVREAPSRESDIKFGLSGGDIVSLVKTEGDWCFVRLEDGRSGWAHEKLFDSSFSQVTDEVAEAPMEITDIRVDAVPDGNEKVIFTLNGFYPPETFVLEEDIPKVVCDFFSVTLGPDVKKHTEINGSFIQKIRIGIHGGAKPKLRVVLDLMPDRNYEVEQVFFKKENLYTLTFKPAGE